MANLDQTVPTNAAGPQPKAGQIWAIAYGYVGGLIKIIGFYNPRPDEPPAAMIAACNSRGRIVGESFAVSLHAFGISFR